MHSEILLIDHHLLAGSDGWDRTSQLISLAQLLAEPYFRTFLGFEVLIEKEWVSAGHLFEARLGLHGASHETSPIFLQFVDCVFQLTMQHPTAFEFNSAYLIAIIDSVYSGRFATLAFNNISARINAKRAAPTSFASLWTHLRSNWRDYKNSMFQGVRLADSKRVSVTEMVSSLEECTVEDPLKFAPLGLFSASHRSQLLHPLPVDTSAIVFWRDYFFRRISSVRDASEYEPFLVVAYYFKK